MRLRLAAAVALPLAALGVQWVLWPWIQPFVWFLFFPTVFFSARLGGYRGGLISTAFSAAIVWYFFVPPQLSWRIASPYHLWSVGLFLFVGYLVSQTQARLERANCATVEALQQARAANEKITQLYEKTRELDELKTRFFANVSHELRTPLTLILGPLGKRLAAGGLSNDERRDLEVMERSARLLYRHVSDLLDVAKLEAKRMTMRYAQADLAQLTRVVASNFDSLAAEKQIRFAVAAPDALPAQIDTEKCERLLLNLLSNAMKFTPAGGAVSLALQANHKRAVLQVSDTGPGVRAEHRQAVFEPFRQLEGGADRRFGGTGLGLAIVKEFTSLHGGTVVVTDAPGGGALFTVELPLTAPPDADVQPAAAALDPLISRQTVDELHPPMRHTTPAAQPADAAALILVVEDNPDMSAYIVGVLGECYRVATAFDGREGFEKALAVKPDLILSDVMMPGMSGDKLVAALRQHRELDDVPLVILTAKADDALRVKLLGAGVQDYLTKPFSAEELRARVDGLVTKRRRTLAEILALNASLERRVEERTAELQAANQELDAFAYAVSHDLRAPLRAMNGFSQALQEEFGAVLAEEGREYLDDIRLASRTMGDLIDGLLQLSRCTRGELHRAEVDLSAMATRILSGLAHGEPERRVTWTVQPGLTARCDERMLAVVLTNLLTNAWKYTGKTEQAVIEVGTTQDSPVGHQASGTSPEPGNLNTETFFVRDNGAGFDMKYAARLFQPFQRMHRQDEFPGIGIGLATVQRIIHRHGGVVAATGEPGKGAVFTIGLSPPAAHAEQEQQ